MFFGNPRVRSHLPVPPEFSTPNPLSLLDKARSRYPGMASARTRYRVPRPARLGRSRQEVRRRHVRQHPNASGASLPPRCLRTVPSRYASASRIRRQRQARARLIFCMFPPVSLAATSHQMPEYPLPTSYSVTPCQVRTAYAPHPPKQVLSSLALDPRAAFPSLPCRAPYAYAHPRYREAFPRRPPYRHRSLPSATIPEQMPPPQPPLRTVSSLW